MQCCLDVAGKAGQQGPHYNIILYVLMALKLLKVSDQVVQEGGEGWGVTEIDAGELCGYVSWYVCMYVCVHSTSNTEGNAAYIRSTAIFHMQWVATPSKKPFPQSPLKSTTLIGYTIPVWGGLKRRHLPHQDIMLLNSSSYRDWGLDRCVPCPVPGWVYVPAHQSCVSL